MCDRELHLSAYAAHRSRELQAPAKLIQSVDEEADPPARPPPTKLRPFVIRSPTPSAPRSSTAAMSATNATISSSQAVSITSSVMRPLSAPAEIKPTVVKQESALSTSLKTVGSANTSKYITSISYASRRCQITGSLAWLLVPNSW